MNPPEHGQFVNREWKRMNAHRDSTIRSVLCPQIGGHWRPFAGEPFEALATRFMVRTYVQFLEVLILHKASLIEPLSGMVSGDWIQWEVAA